MTAELSTLQELTLVWFMFAVLAEVVSTIAFAVWLRHRNVSLIFGMIGVPGYLENRYAGWCRTNNRPSTGWITVRILLMVNVVVAFVAAFPIFVS
jgi:hypothetical protein